MPDRPDYEQRIDRMIARWHQIRTGARRQHARKFASQRSSALPTWDVASGRVSEPARDIEILDRCEVLVVGAGPSGLSAAVSAKRAGADTILVERFGCFGGVITTVGMETLSWYRYDGTTDVEGIGIEMERLAVQMGATTKWPYNDSPCLDADFFKLVSDRLIIESGVRPILHCFGVEAIVEDNRVCGIVVESKSGRQAILADRVCDCTGDADIAFRAGAVCEKADVKDMLGVTTVFNCVGVDKERFLKYADDQKRTYRDWGKTWNQETTGKEDDLKSPYLEEEFAKARAAGIIPENTVNLSGSWSALSDAGEATNLNLAHMSGYDATSVRDLTAAEMEGRQQAMHALTALKKMVPGFENAKLRNFSMTLGTRDTRKIVGRYNLTGEDVLKQARFDDAVGIFPEFVDGYSVLVLPTTGRYFQVPYGCLIPKDIDNLLVAGRCVAGDELSHAAMRNMMACTVTGQAAGAACAVSVRLGVSTQELPMAPLQEELKRQGVRIA